MKKYPSQSKYHSAPFGATNLDKERRRKTQNEHLRYYTYRLVNGHEPRDAWLHTSFFLPFFPSFQYISMILIGNLTTIFFHRFSTRNKMVWHRECFGKLTNALNYRAVMFISFPNNHGISCELDIFFSSSESTRKIVISTPRAKLYHIISTIENLGKIR